MAAVVSFLQEALPVYMPIQKYTDQPDAIDLYKQIQRNVLVVVCRLVTNKESDVSAQRVSVICARPDKQQPRQPSAELGIAEFQVLFSMITQVFFSNAPPSLSLSFSIALSAARFYLIFCARVLLHRLSGWAASN